MGIVEDVVGRDVTVVEWCDPAPDVALLGIGIELVERGITGGRCAHARRLDVGIDGLMVGRGITVVKEWSTPPCSQRAFQRAQLRDGVFHSLHQRAPMKQVIATPPSPARQGRRPRRP